MKVARTLTHNSRGKSLVPGSYWKPCMAFGRFLHVYAIESAYLKHRVCMTVVSAYKRCPPVEGVCL